MARKILFLALLAVLVLGAFLLHGYREEELGNGEESQEPVNESVEETENNETVPGPVEDVDVVNGVEDEDEETSTDPEEEEDISAERFVDILAQNEDVAEFMEEYPYFMDAEEITPEDAEEGLEGPESYLYVGLPDKVVYRVDVYNEDGRGFQTVLDEDEKEILKVYRLRKVDG